MGEKEKIPTMSYADDQVARAERATASFLEGTISPDQVLPEQFYQGGQQGCGQSPERELAVSVLAQAALDIEKCRAARDGQRRRIYRDAFNWVASNDRNWPYSFLNLCDTLSLSPGFLRARLLDESADSVDRRVGAAA